MERRELLKIFSVSSLAAMTSQLSWRPTSVSGSLSGDLLEDIGISASELMAPNQVMATAAPRVSDYLNAFRTKDSQSLLEVRSSRQESDADAEAFIEATTESPNLAHYLEKMRDHDRSHLLISI